MHLTRLYFSFFFNFLFIYLFIYYLFLPVWGLCCCARAFSSCNEQGILFVAAQGVLIAVASLIAEHGLQVHGLQQLWHAGPVVVARGLQSAGSVAMVHGLSTPPHVGSSQTSDQTRVPCIGRRILNHCATREAQDCTFLIKDFPDRSLSISF